MKKLLLLLLPIFGFSQTLQEAKTFFSTDPESYKGKTVLDKVIAKDPKNAEAYYETAKYYLAKNMYNYVRENIEKAVQLSPESVDYRWIRANSVSEKDFQKGIDDLNFMLSKEVKIGKVYFLLGKLNYEYARKLKYQPELKADYGYTDKNTENEKVLAENATKVKELLNQAKTAFKAYENTTGKSAEVFFTDIERMEDQSPKYPMFNDFFDGVNLSEEQSKEAQAFLNKKFTTVAHFYSDVDVISKNKIFVPSKFQSDCFDYYFKKEEQDKKIKSLQKSDYFEIFAFAEGKCYIRDEVLK